MTVYTWGLQLIHKLHCMSFLVNLRRLNVTLMKHAMHDEREVFPLITL
jgi:hypothetical protein